MSRSVKPPKLPLRFFRWFCHPDYAEDIEGDLLERFDKRVKDGKAARWGLLLDVLKLFRPSLLKIQETKLFSPMIKHQFVISYRTLLRNKSNSFLNIGGLALGMTVAILTGLWLHDELTYNQYHKNYEQIGKVLRNERWGAEIETNSSMVTGLGTLLAEEYGHLFEHVGMVRQRLENRVISNGQKKFTQEGYFVQPTIPKMLTLDMLYGSSDGLTGMNTILLSEKVSRKLFGNENPVGEIVQMDANWDLQVTGVYRDIPLNSAFEDASYFAPLDRYLEGWSSLHVWDNYNMWIYVKLHDGLGFEQANQAIKGAMKPHLDEGREDELMVQPMSDWHLYSNYENGELKPSLRLKFVWFFGIIGVFVLALACINFVNLSTARSEKRAKEVGVRKSMGSKKEQLISQFLTESVLVGLMAFIGSVVGVWLTLPVFNYLMDKQLFMPFNEPVFWVAGLLFTLITSLLAGSYPAFYLSSLKVLHVLKGSGRLGNVSPYSRKILVAFQFTISISLIVGTLMVYKQVQMARSRPAGYDRERLVSTIQLSREYESKYFALLDELRKTGVVEHVASSNYSVMSTLGWNNGFDWEERPVDFDPAFNTIRVSADYAKAVGLEFLEGRDFSREFSNERTNVLINESAKTLLGVENPVGLRIRAREDWRIGGRNEWLPVRDFTIIGVVSDMIKGSPFEQTDPSILFLSERADRNLYIRLNPNVSAYKAIEKIGEVFDEVVPSAAFDYRFVDEEYDQKFREEEKMGELAGYLAIIAVLISCLGLFGLSAYVTEQRTKEIGIRKVLGASLISIWKLLSNDYLRLVIIACVISAPISYYFINGWLEGYEIRTTIDWWIFPVAGFVALFIALITVSYQTIKAALGNPVEALRYE